VADPITPDEVVEVKRTVIPEDVIEAVNKLIAQHWDGHRSRFTVDQAVMAIKARTGFSRTALFDLHYLNFEEIYRAAGWDVVYDQPAYDETYPANYTFTRQIAR
jgi:hypothetical protein